ncbi:MAG: PAS domain S-box protein, partial [Anaerolineae bacterium]
MAERTSQHDGIYRIAFENAGDAIFIHRLDGTLLDVNRVACERLGYSREEILGMKLSDIDAPEYTMLIPQRTEALRQQGRLVIESHHRRKDGSTIPVEVNACTIDYDGGETVVLSIARDVTERTRLIEALRQEYDLITTLLDTVDALVVVLDLAGRIALFNRTAEEIMEYTFADVEGRLFWDLFRAPEDIQTVRETFIALRNGLPIREYENVWLTKNGESRLISWSNTALRDEKGAVEYVVATGVDVTELRESEAALRESRQFLESTMNALSAEMAILDEDGTIISVNRAWREFADRNDLAWDDYGVGHNYLTITDAAQGSGAEGAERASQAIRDVIQRRQTEFYLEYPCHATWQQRWFAMRLSRFESESGIRVVVMHENITSQKLVEQALRRSEALFRGVVEQSPDGIVLTDERGRIIEWNQGQERITQIAAREVLGRPLWEVQEALLRGEEGTGAMSEELLRHFLAEGEALDDYHSTEQRLEQPDGSRRVLQSVLFPIKTEQGFMLGTISHDVTERKKAEEIVRESERRLDMMLQTMVDGVVLVDTEGQITYANPAAERILEVNREEVVTRLYHSRQWRQIDETGADFVPEALPLSIALAKRQRVEGLEHGIEMPDGRVKWLSVNAAPLLDEEGELYGAVASFRDITERKQTREALAWESAVNATMAEFARALISQANLEEISYLVLEKAKEFTDSQFGFVGYIDEESGSLVSASMTRDIWDNCRVAEKTVVFHKFSGLWGWVLQNRQPIIVNNPSDDPRSTGIPEGHIPIRRFLSAPALLGDRLVGQIALSNPNRDYVERDLELIERLASLYALAVERHRAETALRKYAEEQATLYAITAAATRLQEPERLLTDVLDHVLSMLGAPTGWVTVPDADNRPRLIATQGLPDTLCERELIGEMDECPIYRPHTHEPEKCSPMLASDCPEIAQTPLWGSETRHICIPLRTADRILGVLTVIWHQPEGRTDLGENLLIAIGQQVGIALYNAQLYKAARQVDRLNVLNELDAALTATLDPEEVIEITLHQLTTALQAPEGTLLLCENAAGECLVRTVRQGQMLSLPSSGSELAWLYPIKDFIAEELPLTPLLTAEIKEHLPDQAIPFEKWREGDLLAPIWNDEGLVGVLILGERRTEKAYTSEDLALVQASVSRARQALQNARLYQASREQSARLATLNEISNVAVSSLDPQ